ncbi:protein-L-isoaspartate(D-aspartate) O-methyltransferase [Paraburkholderia tropica]|uniref:Protein-L-isoaspartate O-methyltransferase n=1 Tax=Paraburkholderia tropica TaxID=92647 RepID=A0ABX5MLU9_9BURK|nr:protein-L-isoaspartate(D-aspartate) O-methyltransferase [Paraburkholderia tropica]MBB3002610.1 protein-L-isoaspartate(D-aspartate) O-methyltransferase [Paraburkholderia tropica]MBB6317741.1 protein-L-isoaspartate(D-aspartate) O-methyltransferase [Paraburkholderia tropica]MDE1141014.1 protein-L-isoaspartate(D-aspartate) O-methyltransferase [Paraburkholderia tropica]PXX14632.1 protein-L-isoaspartate(D-aspartate) O-methyltransferase [Paraburkholderia tropica]PZW79697.1 protein-L-isoaspartate(D
MTGERTKRFPLGLADLVREPRRRDDARGSLASASKPGIAKGTAAPGARGPGASGVVGAGTGVKAAKPPGAAHSAASPARKSAHPGHLSGGSSGSSLGSSPGSPSAKPRADLGTRAAQSFQGASAPSARPSQPHTAVQARPHVTPSAGAPGVALNGALALTSERVRERMVERLRANGVTDPRVLQALAAVPRHMFVDPGLAAQAYEDAALPIGHHQTISKPSVVARMLELAGAGRELDRVLEIGTGCGYQAAVLSRIARDVYSIERIKPLYERAKTNLRPLRIPNIRLHYGDGRLGLPSAAPFDAVVIAAAGFDVPQALLEQLAIGGRLVAPVAEQDEQTQVLTLVERTGPAQWRESRLDRVFFVPLKSGVI